MKQKSKAVWLCCVLLLTLGLAPSTSSARLTTDLGWELVVPNVLTRIWRSNHYETDHTLYITTENDVRRTTDDGDTWTTLFATTPISEVLRISSMAWDPGDLVMPALFVARNVGYDHGEVFRSTDDGLTWETVLAPPSTLLYDIAAVRDADDKLVVFAVGFSPDVPSVWRSADGGDTWALANTGLLGWTDLYRIFPSPNFAADQTVYLTGYSPPLRSTDGGLTWERVAIPWVDIAREVVFSPQYATDGTLWISYFFVEGSGEDDMPPNGVVRSTDFGATWEKVNTGLPVDYLDGYILGLDVSPDYPADPALYAVERTLQYASTPWMLYRSPNGGDRWWQQRVASEATPKGLLVAERDLLFLPTIEGLWRLRTHCWEWIINGGCEVNEAWSFPITPSTAGYSTAQEHTDARAIRVGIVGTANKLAYSSARQRITLPATATDATLTLWLYPTSTETQRAAFSPALEHALATQSPDAVAAGDAQFILIMNDAGAILERLLWTLDDDATWKSYTFDLSGYAGQSIWLHVGVYNDGVGGVTGVYVDDVSIVACESPPETPAPPSPPVNLGAIGEDFLLTDAANYQSRPAVAFNPEDDEYLLAYRDSRHSSLPDIYIQRVRSDGRLLGNAVSLVSDDHIQKSVRVAYLASSDRYLVVWQDDRNITDDVYGQLVWRWGELDGGNFPIAAYPDDQVSPRVAANNASGEFLVVWGNAVNGGSMSSVQGQRIGGSGGGLGARFDVSDGTSWAATPDVAHRPLANDYIVVWKDGRLGNHDIFAQRVLADGALASGNIPVTTAPDVQENPSVAAGGADDAVLVVWEDWRSGQRDIYGTRFAAGTFVNVDIPIGTAPEHEEMPVVALWPTAGDSSFLVVWETRVGCGDLHAQRVTASGSLLGAQVVVSNEPHTQSQPAIAVGRTASQPGYLVVWEDYRVNYPGIYGQRLDVNAGKVGLHVGLTPMDGLQVHPAMAYSETSDRYLVAWYHFDGTGARIAGYAVDGDGSLAWTPVTVTGYLQTPDLAMDVAWDADNDRFLVVWSDVEPATVDDFNVYGQMMAVDGSRVGGEVTVSSAAGQQHAPSVAYSPELARYLIVFESADPVSQTTAIRGQFLTADGMPLFSGVGTNFTITAPGEGYQARHPDVAYDESTRTFLTVWQDNRLDLLPGRWDIYGRQVDGVFGTLIAPEFVIAGEPAHNEAIPRLTALGVKGQYFVVWDDTDMASRDDSDVLGRLLGTSGIPLSPVRSIAAVPDYAEGTPDVAYNMWRDRLLVTWYGAPQSEFIFQADIYARQLRSDGVPETDVHPIAVAADSIRYSPVLAARWGFAEWLIVWSDYRGDAYYERVGVYGRRQAVVEFNYLPLVMRMWPSTN